MIYQSGKTRIGKALAMFMWLVSPPETVDGYLEPFCGALGVFYYIAQMGYKSYVISDLHKDLIQLWKEVKSGKFKMPNKISEKQWNAAKNIPSPSAYKAYVGFGFSFGGRYFSSYADKYNHIGKKFGQYAKNSVLKVQPLLQKSNVHIRMKDYSSYKPKRLLIYCDPPYENTMDFREVEPFDHKKFWDTMRVWTKNNIVFISGYSAPKDFVKVWEQKVYSSAGKNKTNKYVTEKLFIHKSSYDRIKTRIQHAKSRYRQLLLAKKKKN